MSAREEKPNSFFLIVPFAFVTREAKLLQLNASSSSFVSKQDSICSSLQKWSRRLETAVVQHLRICFPACEGSRRSQSNEHLDTLREDVWIFGKLRGLPRVQVAWKFRATAGKI